MIIDNEIVLLHSEIYDLIVDECTFESNHAAFGGVMHNYKQ